ncbi:MMPL family transporter [bacterium]|nr:MMPL family transporter [bacterium]
MPHFFERRDPLGNSPAIWVVALLVFLIPVGWSSLKSIRLENDISTWLPPDDPNLQVLTWAHEQFPVEERIFITWQGSSLADPRIDQLLERLDPQKDEAGVPRGGLPYVSGVAEPREILALLQRNGVEAAEAVRRMEGVILGAGPLRVRLTEAGKDANELRHPEDFLARASRELNLPLVLEPVDPELAFSATIPGYTSATGEEIPDSPAAVLSPAGEIIADATPDHDWGISWKAIGVATPQALRVSEWLAEQQVPQADGTQVPLVESSFFVPGAPVALAVSLSEAGEADKAEAIAAIRAAAASAGITDAEIKMGGSAVASSELNREVLHAAWNPQVPISQFHHRSVILSSALAGAVLAFVLLRSIRLATIILFAGLYTTFLTLSLVPATGGSMNMVLVVMPTLLMVITISGGIHIANYWKHAAGQSGPTAVIESCRAATKPCVLAAVTTAIGLASLCSSSLSPVRDFGLYSSIGTLLSVAMVLIGVPSLMLLWPGTPPHEAELEHPGWRGLGRLMTWHPTVQTLFSFGLCFAMSYGLTMFRTETKVIRYFPDSSRIVQDYWFIENHLAGIVPVETIVKFDTHAQSQANFLDRMEMVRAVQERLRDHAEITGCISLADFQPVAELPDENSLLATSRYHKRANTAEERVRNGEIKGVEAFYHVADQPHQMRETPPRFLNQAGDELWRITSQVNVMTKADYGVILDDIHRISQEVLRLQPGADHVVTGTVPLFLRTQQAVLDSLITSSFMAFGIILLIFIVQLKSIPAGLVSMIPNVVPITMVFGAISYFDIRIDIGTMITASIALGMAVDGTLHFLEWFKKEMQSGKSRQDAVISTVSHCGPAIWQTSWVIALGLLVLLPAELLLISRFGWLMAAMIAVAAWGDLILLPQILASPLGRLFEPRQKPPVASGETSSAEKGGNTKSHSTTFESSAAAVRLAPQ